VSAVGDGPLLERIAKVLRSYMFATRTPLSYRALAALVLPVSAGFGVGCG
jgi:hypothetical protein